MAGFGTPVEFASDPLQNFKASLHNENSWASKQLLVSLTSTLVVGWYIDESDLDGYVYAATVSGDVPTVGTAVVFYTSNPVWPYTAAIERISDTAFILIWKIDGGGGAEDGDGWAVMGSVSGTTITLGTPYLWLDFSALSIEAEWCGITVSRLSTTKAVIAATPSDDPDSTLGKPAGWLGYYICVIEFTAGTTTITGAGTVTVLNGGAGSWINHVDLDVLDSTHVAVAESRMKGGDYSRSDLYFVIMSISGTTPSLNTHVEIWNHANDFIRDCNVMALSSNKFIAIFAYNNLDVSFHKIFSAIVCSISGTTITPGSQVDMINITDSDTPATGEYNNWVTCFINVSKVAFGCNYNVGSSENARIIEVNISGSVPSLGTIRDYDGTSDDIGPGTEIGLACLADANYALIWTDENYNPEPGMIGIYSSAYTKKVLGMSMGKGSGLKLYVTSWGAVSSELTLEVFTLPAMTLDATYSLGSATEAEVDARTWWAHPFAIDGDDADLAIYGRMNDPGGLGTVHLLWSSDEGATVTLGEFDFGDDHIGAMCSDYYGFMYAARNISSASPKLYSTIPGGGLVLLSTAPVNGGVNPKALNANWTGNVIMGVDNGQAILVVYTPSPYVRWYDITGNHGVASGITSVEVL